jgi:hypothetical protein
MDKDCSKSPVSEDRIERFFGLVANLAGVCEVEAEPEIYHYVELLGEAVARYSFQKTHKASPQKKVHDDRTKFIAIFKSRYRMEMDLEYSKKITPIEGKIINQINKLLMAEGFSCEDFLGWFFETFLVENPKFKPPTIKSICSQFIVHSFLAANREVSGLKKKEEVVKKDGMDLIGRARVVMRTEGVAPETLAKLREALKGYSDRRIMLPEFRAVVETAEKETRQTKGEDGNE